MTTAAALELSLPKHLGQLHGDLHPAEPAQAHIRLWTWTTPQIAEIAVGLEINSYACAEMN